MRTATEQAIEKALENAYKWLERTYPEGIWPGRGELPSDGFEARTAREDCKDALAALREQNAPSPGGVGEENELLKAVDQMIDAEQAGGDRWWSGFEKMKQARKSAQDVPPVRGEEQSPWISVEDRLPEDGQRVLVRVPEEATEDYTSVWTFSIGQPFSVTHWMPLPDPPSKH